MNERKQQLLLVLEDLKNEEEAGVSLSRRSEIEQNRKAIQDELAAIDSAEAAKVQVEQEHEQRVNDSLTATDQLLEQIELKKYIGDGADSQLLSIRIKRAFMAQAEDYSNQIKESNEKFNDQLRASQDREHQLQRQYNQLQTDYESLEEKYRQLEFEKIESDRKRDAAVQQTEEFKAQVKQLESWNQDLREQAAFGVKASLNIIDDEETKRQEAALEAQLKRERTIYNKAWVNPIKKDTFKAYKAINGEYFEFNWTLESMYNVIDESEVSQFREQYGVQAVPEVPSVVETPVQNSTAVGGPQFPEVTAPNVDTSVISSGGVQGQSSDGTSQAKEGTDGESPATKAWVEQRLEALKQEIMGAA